MNDDEGTVRIASAVDLRWNVLKLTRGMNGPFTEAHVYRLSEHPTFARYFGDGRCALVTEGDDEQRALAGVEQAQQRATTLACEADLAKLRLAEARGESVRLIAGCRLSVGVLRAPAGLFAPDAGPHVNVGPEPVEVSPAQAAWILTLEDFALRFDAGVVAVLLAEDDVNAAATRVGEAHRRFGMMCRERYDAIERAWLRGEVERVNRARLQRLRQDRETHTRIRAAEQKRAARERAAAEAQRRAQHQRDLDDLRIIDPDRYAQQMAAIAAKQSAQSATE